MKGLNIKKSLPFTCNVKLTSYPYLADYLSILESNGNDCSGIIFNNYIEIFYKPWKGQIRFLNHLNFQSNLEILKFHYLVQLNLLSKIIINILL